MVCKFYVSCERSLKMLWHWGSGYPHSLQISLRWDLYKNSRPEKSWMKFPVISCSALQTVGTNAYVHSQLRTYDKFEKDWGYIHKTQGCSYTHTGHIWYGLYLCIRIMHGAIMKLINRDHRFLNAKDTCEIRAGQKYIENKKGDDQGKDEESMRKHKTTLEPLRGNLLFDKLRIVKCLFGWLAISFLGGRRRQRSLLESFDMFFEQCSVNGPDNCSINNLHEYIS